LAPIDNPSGPGFDVSLLGSTDEDEVEAGSDVPELGVAELLFVIVFNIDDVVAVLIRSEFANRTRIECAFMPFVMLVVRIGCCAASTSVTVIVIFAPTALVHLKKPPSHE
jgi:hypothetical protein